MYFIPKIILYFEQDNDLPRDIHQHHYSSDDDPDHNNICNDSDKDPEYVPVDPQQIDVSYLSDDVEVAMNVVSS